MNSRIFIGFTHQKEQFFRRQPVYNDPWPTPNANKRYSEEEKQYIERNQHHLTSEEMAEDLGRGSWAVECRVKGWGNQSSLASRKSRSSRQARSNRSSRARTQRQRTYNQFKAVRSATESSHSDASVDSDVSQEDSDDSDEDSDDPDDDIPISTLLKRNEKGVCRKSKAKKRPQPLNESDMGPRKRRKLDSMNASQRRNSSLNQIRGKKKDFMESELRKRNCTVKKEGKAKILIPGCYKYF